MRQKIVGTGWLYYALFEEGRQFDYRLQFAEGGEAMTAAGATAKRGRARLSSWQIDVDLHCK
jgi:hypothetical protein